MLDRIYRIILVVAAAAIFGLLLYWLAPDVTPYVGENGAALWSWFLIVASGFVAHRLLPDTDLSAVSHVLLALLVSAIVAMIVAWAFVLVVDLGVDEGAVPQVLIAGLATLAFAGTVYVPIYVMRGRLGRSVPFIYLLAGALLPASCVLVWRPLGQEDTVANLLAAALLGCLGVSSAIGFAVAAARSRD